MAKTREQKEQILSRCEEIFESGNPVAFVNFHGITANEANEMRQELFDKGLRYYVAKKTIAGIALEDASIEGERPELEGELALVYHQDVDSEAEDKTAPARAIYEFQEKFEERVEIIGGIFEDEFADQEEMTDIAQIPSAHVLRGQFVQVINSPIKKLAVALNQIAEKQG